MTYFLYKMQSDTVPPGGGDFMSWLHYYKWGRPETVTFLKTTPYFKTAKHGDVMFFVLDGFLIGDALIHDVRDDMPTFDGKHFQEIDVAEGQIWEYNRTFSLWDRWFDKWQLNGLEDEIPQETAVQWLEITRDASPWHLGKIEGRPAGYNPDVLPPFFKIKRK